MAARFVPLLTTAPASGIATVSKQPPSGYKWNIRHIGISCNGSLLSTCSVFQNGAFVCGSQSGNNDSADGASILLQDGDTLTLTWSGASPASVCTAVLLVDELGRTDPVAVTL